MHGTDHILQVLATRYARQHRQWFTERQRASSTWPLALSLGRPIEKELVANPAGMRAWVADWERFAPRSSGVHIEWGERHWPRLGRQRLPERAVLASAADVADWVGEGSRWQLACERADQLTAAWPVLLAHTVLGSAFDALADYAGDDFERLVALLRWADVNPSSGLYLRQLPVPGLDTKWIASRAAVVTGLLRVLRGSGREGHGGSAASDDLASLLGLRRVEARLRVRLLCPLLRQRVAGLEDLELPVSQLAALDISPSTVLIVENLETGLALPELPGAVVLMKLGAAVKLVAQLPWVYRARSLYWGDIDTFGFEILNRARSVLPDLGSALMDVGTLLAHRSLCVCEPTQVATLLLQHLKPQEREVYDGLRSNRWGERLRLEQERIPWQFARDRIWIAAADSSTGR